MTKEDNVVGSTGMRLGDLKPNYTPKDFKIGYEPHILCLYGAVCEKCKLHLELNK